MLSAQSYVIITYADPCNGGSRRRLYITSRRDITSRCPRKSIRARTLHRISPPRLSVGVLPARYSSFSSVYTIVALCEIFVNRFSEIFAGFLYIGRQERAPALPKVLDARRWDEISYPPKSVGRLCEQILSVLFGQGAAKRTKNGVKEISRLRARLGSLPQVPAAF